MQWGKWEFEFLFLLFLAFRSQFKFLKYPRSLPHLLNGEESLIYTSGFGETVKTENHLVDQWLFNRLPLTVPYVSEGDVETNKIKQVSFWKISVCRYFLPEARCLAEVVSSVASFAAGEWKGAGCHGFIFLVQMSGKMGSI